MKFIKQDYFLILRLLLLFDPEKGNTKNLWNISDYLSIDIAIEKTLLLSNTAVMVWSVALQANLVSNFEYPA